MYKNILDFLIKENICNVLHFNIFIKLNLKQHHVTAPFQRKDIFVDIAI